MEVDAESAAQADEAIGLIDKIKPLLAKRDPAVTSAVLADLFSMFLAGHQDLRGEGAFIDDIREKIIERWIRLVRDLVPINAAQIREQHGLSNNNVN